MALLIILGVLIVLSCLVSETSKIARVVGVIIGISAILLGILFFL